MPLIIPALLALVLSCDPALAARFTPLHPPDATYEACTTQLSIDEVLSENRTAANGADAFTFGAVELLEPVDAFGTAGSYSPADLTRLYVGRRVRVVRGWISRDGRVESRTLLSPYPDAALAHLNQGTLIITRRPR